MEPNKNYKDNSDPQEESAEMKAFPGFNHFSSSGAGSPDDDEASLSDESGYLPEGGPEAEEADSFYVPDASDDGPDSFYQPDEADEEPDPLYGAEESEDGADLFYPPEETEGGQDLLYASDGADDEPDSFYTPDGSEDDQDPFYQPDGSEYEPESDDGADPPAGSEPDDENGIIPESGDGFEGLFGDGYGGGPENGISGELPPAPDPASGSEPVPQPAAAGKPGNSLPSVPPDTLLARLEAKGKAALTAVWQPVGGADGYDVFFAPSGTGFSDPFRTVSSEETAVTFGHLEKKTAYKARVSAFALSRGRKTYLISSLTLHSITGGGTKKHTNAQEIVLNDERLVLPAGKKKRITAEVIGQNAGKQVLARGGTLRYLSGNPEVAAVTNDGKVYGVSAGSGRIWLIAANGVHASLDVSVIPEAASVFFKKKKYSLKVGEKINLRKKLKGVPDTEPSSLKWKSSDRKIAEVSKKGIVKARKKGKATVWVKTAEGGLSMVRIRVSPDKKDMKMPWDGVGAFGSSSGGNESF